MSEKLLNISEESTSLPYFLIVKLNNQLVFDAIGRQEGFVFRDVFKEKLIAFAVSEHASFKKENSVNSSLKLSNTDYLWLCIDNKDFFNRFKSHLELISESELLGNITSFSKEEISKEIDIVFAYASLQSQLPSKDIVVKKLKI
jgi:hypothetical protein